MAIIILGDATKQSHVDEWRGRFMWPFILTYSYFELHSTTCEKVISLEKKTPKPTIAWEHGCAK